MTDWFARPVLHISNVEASLRSAILLIGALFLVGDADAVPTRNRLALSAPAVR